MRLVCPSCGAVCSIEGWANDAAARQCVALLAEMPGGAHALQYLALFRPGARGLSWTRTLTLLRELDALIKAPFIQWDRKVARANAPAVWAQAMDKIGECPPRKLPLKSHGYLHAIAYDLADEMDRESEKSKREVENSGKWRSKSGAEAQPERIDEAEMRQITEKLFRQRGRNGAEPVPYKNKS